MNTEELYSEAVNQIRNEINRWQNEPVPERPTHLMCLEDIRFERLFLQQLCDLHKLIKFVSPLVGKTVKINGFKFEGPSGDQSGDGGRAFKTELDYEVL